MKQLWLVHSAKGSSWEDHAYLKVIDGKYYYPDSYKGGRHLSSLKNKATGPAKEIEEREANGFTSSEYVDGDHDFDEENYSDENLLGDTDFYGFKKPDGSFVILEEDNKWVIPSGIKDPKKLIKNLEDFSNEMERKYNSGEKYDSSDWKKWADDTIKRSIKEQQVLDIKHSNLDSQRRKATSEYYIAHHGIKGQKWGVRRFQNEDGTLTPLGRQRLGFGEAVKGVGKKIGGAYKSIARGVAERSNAREKFRQSRIESERKLEQEKADYYGDRAKKTKGLSKFLNEAKRGNAQASADARKIQLEESKAAQEYRKHPTEANLKKAMKEFNHEADQHKKMAKSSAIGSAASLAAGGATAAVLAATGRKELSKKVLNGSVALSYALGSSAVKQLSMSGQTRMKGMNAIKYGTLGEDRYEQIKSHHY